MREVSLVSEGERCPSARGTEALRSCFRRPGRHSMTTGSRESSRSTCRRRGARLWRLQPPARRGHPCPREEKSRGKNRGGDITSMCLLRGLPRPRRVRPVEKSRTGCAGAAGGRPSAQAQGWSVLVANPVSEWPFGSPWVRKGRTTKNRRPDRRARRPVTASLPAIVRNCAIWGGILFAPEPVSAHRPPFTVGLTTSAVSGSSRRPPGCFRCGQRTMNPC